MRRWILLFLSTLGIFVTNLFAFPGIVQAHCPLCVAGAATGLTLTRLLGVDDSITGLWLGAFLGAMSIWTFNLIIKKVEARWHFLVKVGIYLLVFASTIWSFYQFNLIVTMEKMYGLHKLTFGIVVGGITFYLMEVLNDLIKKKVGRVLFPYQRIVFSLGMIGVVSLIDYILIGYYI